jgi:hypothetical protein
MLNVVIFNIVVIISNIVVVVSIMIVIVSIIVVVISTVIENHICSSTVVSHKGSSIEHFFLMRAVRVKTQAQSVAILAQFHHSYDVHLLLLHCRACHQNPDGRYRGFLAGIHAGPGHAEVHGVV